MSELRKNYAQDQLAKERAVEAKLEAGIKAEEEKLAKTKETFKQSDLLGLPAPAKEIAPSIDEPVLVNPLGNITPDELGPEVTGYVNKYRKDNGMPQLQSYSIEDIKDAMTAVNPEGEQGALDAILTAKTGYSGAEKYTPEDVTNAALEKNVASDTKGFNDFLSRTTGNPNLTTMSPPQLFSAFKALKDMPANETGAQIVLPEGTNASRFKPAQYKKAIDYVGLTFDEMGGTPLSIDTIVKDIQESTGLETERDARALLDTAIKNNDLAENREVVFRTTKPDTGELVSTFRDKDRAEAAAKKQGLNLQETTLVTVKPAVKEEITKPRAALPEGYDIAETAFVEGEKTTGYNITPEGRVKPLATVMEENEIPAKIERLQGLRRKEADQMVKDIAKHEATVQRGRNQLESMEARGEVNTEGYALAESRQKRAEKSFGLRINSLKARIEQYSAPLQAKPVGKKTITRKGFTVSKQGQKSGTFPTREAAEESILADLPDEALDALVSDKKFGGLQNRAVAEQNRRRSGTPTTGKKVSEVLKSMEPKEKPQSPEAIEKTKELRAKLDKMGLQDVGLKIVEAINAKADGSYEAKLIQIALDSEHPVRTMRHEAMHALKELGFFTDAQWASLEKMARSKWVGQYLKSKNAYLPDGKMVTRYDAYTLPKDQGGQGLTESEALEEAIADAFGDYDVNKAPPGMLTALLNKMRNFFDALTNYLAGRGFESYQDVFGKIEKGELKATEAEGTGTKLSLAGEGVPMSTRNLMEVQTPIAQQQLGLNTEIKRGRFNNVRSIAIALNQFTLDNIGPMDRNDLSTQESTQIARAIADEVAYQLGTQAKTGTGLGWYSNNYPKAVRRLARRFPELGTSKYARSVFSALVAVTSNGERVTKNIDNAIKLYAKLRQGKPLVAMSNRRATALENNLIQIQRLIDTYGEDFESVLLKEITVKEMNALLREMGEKSDGSYLANTVVPAAAVYFGPKLGAFYANLSGSEGYLTMDLWWTRSINRMRGLLIPKATEASIDKFRDMMDIPDATRDEVISASVPLRNKYKEYGFNTELEHIVKAKEPAKKEQKPAWFKKAEETAGDAYDQMLYEHNLEKMANTIYKNEFEMLEEAPFTATDRKFMYDAARKAQTMLRKEDINLTLADIQAALWYYEKRLYAKLSGKKADDIGYEEAIIAQSNQGNGRARRSVVFDKQPDGGTQPGGESGQANPVRGKSYTAQQGLRDENIQSGEPTVRSSTGSGKKLSLRGERGGQREDSRFTPLALAPSVKGFHGPDPRIVEVAERYAEKNGINLKRQAEYVQVEGNKDAEDRATRIAKAYEDMRHDPQNPEVKEAYQNLIDQTISQYEALVDAGYKFWFIDLNNSDNLDYLSSPWNALRDMRSNKQIGIFPTNIGFGSNEDFDPSNNPLLQETEFEWPIGSLNGPKQKVLANDVFRAVHDAFGHGLEGAGFKATGEENAWQAHSRLFTGSALKAITSETRGQNSAVNYGPNGEFNRKANPADTIYADQKVGLMPAWTWKEGLSADEPIFQELDSKKDATRFLNAVERVKVGRPYAFPLHVHDLDTYKNAKLFLSEDEESGFALIGDEIGSFFSGGRGQAYPTLRLAVDEGGRRIDTYRTKLPSVMGKANFRPVARVEFNAELATPLWDKNKFKQFQGGKPDLVFYSYDPSFNARGDKDAGDLAVSKTPLVEYDEAVRLQKEAVKNTKYSLRGITLGEQQPQAQSFNGVHYGKTKVDTLSGSKYGTGIRGAERRRLDDAFDDRIKRRAYFYIPKEDGSMPLPESGLGGYVYTQKFNNILGPGQEMSRLFSQAKGDSNDFESNVVDAGYDGYAIPKMGMMVVLNHDVPVSYEGTKFEYDSKKKLSLRAAPDTPEFKRFFGDSKVVDANGEPKVMYHGTGQDILAFRGKQADAIFLTDDPSFAEKFSKDSAAWMSAHPEEFLSKAELAQGVKDAIAAIRKDYKSRPEGKVMIDSLKAGTYKDATAEAQEYLRNAYKQMMPSGPNILPVYVSAQNPFDYEDASQVQQVVDELNKNTDSYGRKIGDKEKGDLSRGNWERIEKSSVQKAIRALNFDGFYVREGSYKNLAVYEPTQIKSATGNIGTYDVNNPDIRYSLRNIGDEIRSMPNGKDIYGSMKGTTTTRDEKGFIERMMDAISPESRSSIRQKALNRYNQLSVYDRELVKKMGGAALLADASAEAGALQSDLAAGVAAAALGVRNRKGGIPVFKNGITTVDTSVKGPIEIFSPLAAMGDPEAYQAYQFWSGAKRGSRFLADGKEKVFTLAMVNYAKQLCDVDAKGNVSGKYPEFAKIQKEWTEYNNGLVQYMVDTGVLSKEKANEFTRHGDYIPFYRQLDGEKTVGPNIFQSISGVKPPKALKGSEAPLADFLETVVRNTQAAIQSGMKNTAAQRAVDVAVQIQQAKQLPEQSSAPDTVTVLRGGKPVSYQTADPLFIEAVKSLNLPELPFLSILSGPANLLRNLVTKDPGFMLANLMRDSMSAYVTSGANMLPVVDTVKNFGRAIQGTDPAYEALLNAGLLGGYEFSQSIEASGEALAKDLRKKTGTQTGFEKATKPFTSLWDALEKGTEASDAATRMAVYKDTLARTNNEAEALFRALEVMNFNRKGSSAVVRILTAAIPFLNARMQGLDVFYRAAFGRMGNADAKAIQKSFFVRGATLASLSVMYWALTHDDEDYKKQEQETKDNNWLFPSLGIRIPIPFEVGVLFKVIPERLAAYAFGNDTGKDLSKSMGRALTSTFGIAPPQVALPLLEAKTNYSFYTGRPIISQGLEGVAPQYQVGANTSPMFEKLGKELGASPMMLEHIYKGYTGSMGMYLVDLMDAIGVVNDNSPKAAKRFEQLPIIKRFALDKEARGTVTSYYELKKEVDTAVRTFNFLERAGQGEDLAEYTRENAKMLMTRDFISSMDKDIKEINEMAMAVRNSPMSPEAKRDALTALNRASSAMTAKIQNVRKAVE